MTETLLFFRFLILSVMHWRKDSFLEKCGAALSCLFSSLPEHLDLEKRISLVISPRDVAFECCRVSFVVGMQTPLFLEQTIVS